MIGTILNAGAIVAGGVMGWRGKAQLSAVRQHNLKVLLGVLTVAAGLKLLWLSFSGSVGHIIKLFLVVMVSMSLGKLLGRALGVQKLSNGFGHYARERLAHAGQKPGRHFNDGFVTCSVLFCVAPLAILGPLLEGLNGNWSLLALKAAMDGLAAMSFVGVFGPGAILSVLPVVAWQGVLTLAAQLVTRQPWWSQSPAMQDALTATLGLLAFSVALLVLEIKKIEVADYLPSLFLAPLLARWLL